MQRKTHNVLFALLRCAMLDARAIALASTPVTACVYENGLTTCGYYPIKLVVLKLCYGLYNAHDSETVGLD